MIYLLDTNVILHLANEVEGSQGIEQQMRALGVAMTPGLDAVNWLL